MCACAPLSGPFAQSQKSGAHGCGFLAGERQTTQGTWGRGASFTSIGWLGPGLSRGAA